MNIFNMWVCLILLVAFSAVSVSGEEIFDVTTIYNVTEIKAQPQISEVTGRIHARTNSLGIALQDGSDKHYVVSRPVLNFTCNPAVNNCNWSKKGWNSMLGKWTRIKGGVAYPIAEDNKLSIGYVYQSDMEGYMYFTSRSSSIRDQGTIYLFRIGYDRGTSYNNAHLFNDCWALARTSGHYTLQDRDGSQVEVYCRLSNISHFDLNYQEDMLNFDFNDKIKIFLYENYSNPLEDWTRNHNIRYFSMSGDLLNQQPSLLVPILESKEHGSELVSPTIILESRQLCIVLLAQTNSETSNNALDILALDLYQVEHLLQTVFLKAGWNVKHINVTVQSKVVSPINVIIRKVGPAPVNISYISSCSGENEEVVEFSFLLPRSSLSYDKVLPPLLDDWRLSAPVHTARSDIITRVELVEDVTNLTNYCMNGGVLTTAGCACPPGFSGSSCQVGCGRNRYGMDCGGQCSLQSQECAGLIMCTYFTKCACAPGYTGPDCQDGCPSGKYGNDCLQNCVNCVDCDKHSGECITACKPGYVPPSCAQAFVYYAFTPELKSDEYETIQVSFDSKTGISGVGVPKFFQIQYKEKNDLEWKTYTSKVIPPSVVQMSSGFASVMNGNKITETINGLKSGVSYQVRILLMDSSFNKYDGKLIKASEVLTKCYIPEEYDYKTTAVSNATSLTLLWKYDNSSANWCRVESFEVSWKESWKVLSNCTKDESLTLTNFLPGSTITFRVRANTTNGFAPFSKITTVSSLRSGLTRVKDLRVVSAQSTAVDVSWSPPQGSESLKLQYRVTYECVNQLACSPGCDNASEVKLVQEATSVTLNALLPFTQYRVTVSAVDGPNSTILVGTTEVEPTEIPKLGAQNPIRTNTSATVFWEPVPVCSSFFLGYYYQLSQQSSRGRVLMESGYTKDTNVTVTNLSPSTDYVVRIFIYTVAGYHWENYLKIYIPTSSAPTALENLKLLNSSTTSVSLQWQHPNLTNGVLRSFLVNVEETEQFDQDNCCQTYHVLELAVKEEEKTYEIEVSGLNPASTYYVSVTAKTVALGPSQSLVVYTKPPHLPLSSLPSQETLEELTSSDVSWLPQDSQYNNSSEVFSSLIKTRLLLAVLNKSVPLDLTKSGLNDSLLESTILSHTVEPFFFCTEYDEEGETVADSVWGHSLSSLFSEGVKYQLIAVQVTEYNGVYNVDLRYSSPFTY